MENEKMADFVYSSFSSVSDLVLASFLSLQEAASYGSQISFPVSSEENEAFQGNLNVTIGQINSDILDLILNTVRQDKCVAVFSFLSREELTLRLLATESRVDLEKFISPALMNENDWKALQAAAGVFMGNQIFISDAKATWQEMLSCCNRIRTFYGIDLVVLDCLPRFPDSPETPRTP
jgi:DnaB-like helicase C terminal domain